MKLNTLKIIIMLFFLSIHVYGTVYSFEDVNINGLTFKEVRSWGGDAIYGLYYANNSMDIIIPDSVTAKVTSSTYMLSGHTYTYSYYEKFPVTMISNDAFKYCKDLERITISSTISTIEAGAFSWCPNLEEINFDGENRFYYLKGETLYDYSSNSIHTIIPQKSGETFFIADSIYGFNYTAFANCPISRIIVDEKNPHYFAEDGILCSKRDSTIYLVPPGRRGTLSLPLNKKSKYQISSYALYETSLDQIIIWDCPYSPYYSTSAFEFLKELPKDKKMYAINSAHAGIKEIWPGTIRNLTELFPLNEIKKTLTSIEFSISKSDDINVAIEDLELALLFYDDIDITKKGDNFFIDGLNPGNDYMLIVSLEENGMTRSLEYKLQSQTPYTSFRLLSNTQTSLTFSCVARGDETISCEEYGIYMNGTYYKVDEENRVCLTGLSPNTTYNVCAYARYKNGYLYKTNSSSFKTKAINLYINGTVQPTSITCTGIYEVGDAEIEEYGFNSENAKGDKLLLTGLEPNKEYSVTFFIRTKDGYSTYVRKTFTTPALELTTLQPKCVSSSCAIVAAKTNISGDEPSVGFQWKKYDAPESLNPNEGYAAIYNGQLEGYIKNLQLTSYYNVRAFYKSAGGTYYYGDWVTFDPSDFSYFEPTVHTYNVTDVTSNTAKVKGYVMAGTDDITEQGFEYRPFDSNDAKVRAVHVAAAADNSGDDVITVFATGQVMTAELRDLNPETTYTCRAFVKTATGTTYGEEQTFTTTADVTGIATVDADASKPDIEGCYDLNGRKIDKMQHGINIIRYTDGTTRKVFVR